MSDSQMFARLLPIDIKFFNGESPSPQKMNGIFNYVQAAFYILESFLGNGIDYRMPSGDPANRKMLFNISQVLGNTGKLYKPVNKLVMNEYIHRNFGAINMNLGPQDVLHTSHTTYDAVTEMLTVRDDINIPVCIDTKGEAYYIGLYYTGAGTLSLHGGNVNESQTFTLAAQSKRTFFFFASASSYIDYITFTPGTPDPYGARTPLVIESVYLCNAADTDAAVERVFEIDSYGNTTSNYTDVLRDYNSAYAVPLDNTPPTLQENAPTFWTIKKPCYYAVNNYCSRKSCGYCIGNVYDTDVQNDSLEKIGAPICGGLNDVYSNIHPYLVPKDKRSATLGQRLQYLEADFSANSQATVYTIQSPVLLRSKPYMSKLRPFRAHRLGTQIGVALAKNETVVYDLSSRTNPIRYNIPIYSAGRPDIVFVYDTNKELVPGPSVNIQILGGPYTMTEFIEDLMIALNNEKNPQPAVYAD